MPTPPKFKKKDNILCFHRSLLYDAIIQDVDQTVGQQTMYRVHYVGWNKKWDEWVPPSRLRLPNAENKRLQTDLAAQGTSKSAQGTSKLPTATNGTVDSTDEGNLKSKFSNVNEAAPIEPKTNGFPDASKQPTAPIEMEDITLDSPVRLVFPQKLRDALVDDNNYVKRHQLLSIIPAPISAEAIIEQYLQARKPPPTQYVRDVCRGLIELFSVLLGSQLLYKPERPQYADILALHPKTLMSKIYGGIFLLRCFVHMSQRVHLMLPEEEPQVKKILHEILEFLENNFSKYFGAYQKMTPAYWRRTMY